MPLIFVLDCPGFHIAAFGATEGLQFEQRPGEWCYRGPPVWCTPRRVVLQRLRPRLQSPPLGWRT
eukprot:11894226-Alexandrium_andersonii.AAC.1